MCLYVSIPYRVHVILIKCGKSVASTEVSIPYRVHVIFDEEKDTNKTIIVSIPYRVHVIMINVLSNLILFILRLFQFLIGFM